MRYQEAYLGSREELAGFLRKIVPDLFAGRLAIEGKTVELPAEADLDYKLKYDEDVEGGSVSIKIIWENETEEDEENTDD